MKTTEQEKFYTAKYDRIFKSIFLSENSKDLMASLLKSILGREVKIIDYPPCNIPVKKAWEKATTVDFIVELDGEVVHLEVETGTSLETRMKNFIGFIKVISQNATRKESYDTETRYLHIDFQYGLGPNKKLISKFHLDEEEDDERYLKNIEMLSINMDSAKNFWYTNDKLNIEKYKYLIMLDLDGKELDKLKKGDDLVEKFQKKLCELNDWDRFKSDMTMEEKEKMVANTKIYNAEKKGLEDGKKLGLEVGKKENQIEIVKNLKAKNMDLQFISEITGLSIDEIKNIVKDF